MYLIGGLLIMLLAVVIVALGYRGKAKAEQRHAELQKMRADYAEADVKQRRRLDLALETIQETHREETINDSNPTHLAARNDFDNNWSAAPGLRDSSANANSSISSTTATDSTGTAGDSVERDDMLGR